MVEFQTMYYGPMEQEYHQSISEAPRSAELEKPIFPIKQLGQTIPEKHPSGRNLLQNAQAAIRGGNGVLQLILTEPAESALGGRPKAYGEEVRQALKEIQLANNAMIQGIEMPTRSITNLSGWDNQRGFSDEKRRRDLEEVKDALRMAAEISGGGGVDLWSQEFARQINQPDDPHFKQFENPSEEPLAQVVDTRTGEIARLPVREKIALPLKKVGDRYEDVIPVPGEVVPEPIELSWDDFKRWAREETKRTGETVRPETLLVRQQFIRQKNEALGVAAESERRAEIYAAEMREAEQAGDTDRLESRQRQFQEAARAAQANRQRAKDIEERMNSYVPMDVYAKKRSFDGFAQAGITAMIETKAEAKKGTLKKDLYVGPELGWPGQWGGHPQEFKELIKGSRNRMVDLLTKEKVENEKGETVQNPYFDPKLASNPHEAKRLAQRHIKGLFDSSHMGMWLQYFKTHPYEDEKSKQERFKKWFLGQVNDLANDPDQVVGSIQWVDTITGQHAHLPPGQGFLPLQESAKIFADAGFTGMQVSEGHEEEPFGQGRIHLKTWEEFGGGFGGHYHGGGAPTQWGQVQQGYMGRQYAPMFMFGAYSPSNEFKLWSEVPLE